jgi:hypothetical protein
MSSINLKEHVFPFKLDDDLLSAKDLDEWFARFVGLRSDEVAKILRDEWGAIRSPAVASFRDAICAFKPISLIHSGDERDDGWYKGWWLRMKGPRTYHSWDTDVFLHSPPVRTALVECIDHYSLPEPEVITEFCSFFYRIQNSMNLWSGFLPPPWYRFEEWGYYRHVDGLRPLDPNRKWADAYFIYTTDTGDKVLMKPDGEVGWALAAERRIREFAPSFSEFLEQCALCYRVHGVLDYYAWDEFPFTANLL